MKRSLLQMWGWPIAIAVSTLAGLIAGLVGDGAWDLLAAVALGVPALACVWLGSRRSTRRHRQANRAP
ncbi:hypothetical protein KTQ42_02000|uniref:hypothetical protein n=1 Tax=Noviherbaspirillum sp. L7-7A TaxID=2850560 RepID=UPI001C2C7AE5|nr:hypothetical protein [Noviherbaspirillum sp. L7-7A]MBV0878075.1 hypothetical protein [Noviherbaspirillum sp. L7-7A]